MMVMELKKVKAVDVCVGEVVSNVTVCYFEWVLL